jgi:hypothetical protein
MSLGIQVNFFRGDSCGAAGVLYMAAESFLSITVLCPGGHAPLDLFRLGIWGQNDIYRISLTVFETDI